MRTRYQSLETEIDQISLIRWGFAGANRMSALLVSGLAPRSSLAEPTISETEWRGKRENTLCDASFRSGAHLSERLFIAGPGPVRRRAGHRTGKHVFLSPFALLVIRLGRARGGPRIAIYYKNTRQNDTI